MIIDVWTLKIQNVWILTVMTLRGATTVGTVLRLKSFGFQNTLF